MIERECALNSSLFIVKTKTLDRNTNSKKAVFQIQWKILHAPGWQYTQNSLQSSDSAGLNYKKPEIAALSAVPVVKIF